MNKSKKGWVLNNTKLALEKGPRVDPWPMLWYDDIHMTSGWWAQLTLMISFLEIFGCQWHEICQKNYLERIFRQKNFTHSKCVICDYFYSQYNNINASKLVFWVNLGNNLTECVEYQQQQSKITLGVWKFCIFTQDMQETALFAAKKIPSWPKFYTTAGREKISTLVVIVKKVLKSS